MKLIVDASVVVKWFVEEEGQAEALAILERGDECFAPDLVLVEVAGALDKKLKAGTVTRDQVDNAISAVQAHMTMVAGSKLIESALDFASELNHPVADCLYLACGLELGAILATADSQFLVKARSRGYGGLVRQLGEEDEAMNSVSVSASEIKQLIDLTNRALAIFESVRSELTKKSNTFLGKVVAGRDLEPAFNSLAYQNLVRLLRSMESQQRQDILTLCWFGQHHTDNWADLKKHALSMDGGEIADIAYLISKMHYLQAGINRVRSLPATSESSTHG